MTAEALGMNKVSLAILIRLAERGGRATTTELADDLGYGKATILRQLDTMATASLVSRDRPRARGGTAITWTLHPEQLAAQLNALMSLVIAPGWSVEAMKLHRPNSQ